MLHELKKIVSAASSWKEQHIRAVLATVVALDGTSYRKPGVRMLISESGDFVGAVSGGCVEKEIVRRSRSVFQHGIPEVITYDGRFRLGCEGILYILIEPFSITASFVSIFSEVITRRETLSICSNFEKQDAASNASFGSCMFFDGKAIPFRPDFSISDKLPIFDQALHPCFQLIIIGAEHDAVKLCDLAARTGWEVHVVLLATRPKIGT
ncbi:MAG: XdhC family protein [Bacteroidia bacterium]